MLYETLTQMEGWSSKCEYNIENLKEQLSPVRSLLFEEMRVPAPTG